MFHGRCAVVLCAALLGLACNQSARDPGRDEAARREPAPRSAPPREPELRVLEDGELTPAIQRRAQQILDQHHDRPYGHEVPFELGGRRYVGRIEEHYHPPGSGREPEGEHTGVTVYAVE